MKKNKLLLLGWDAADWKIINPLIEQGLMPNLEKLINGGTISNLATLDPPYSPMLWTSMATGKRPYKHGVLGFTELSPDGKKVRPVMSISRKCKALWNILSQKGIKNHVVGWWPSHPAEKINGIMVSNFYQNHVGDLHEPWPMAKGTVYPSSMSTWFEQFRVHPQEINGSLLGDFINDLGSIDLKQDKRYAGVAKITAHCTTLHAAFTNIIRTQEWDFAALYLDAIDHYCHGYMKYHPPKRPHIPEELYHHYHTVVTNGYRYHDLMLGTILSLVDDSTTVLLVSDHGFQPDHLRPRNIPREPAGPAYEHSAYGILVAKGPGIKKDHITYGASVLDLTPTILHLLDLPVGKDMDGRVLTNILEKPKDIQVIESWETEGSNFQVQVEDALSDEESNLVLAQLEDLGYIDKQTEDLEKRIKQTDEECRFNLARAHIDGGNIVEAAGELESLVKEVPGTARYIFRLAICYQILGKYNVARKLVEEMKDKELYDNVTLDVLEATLLLAEKQPLKAIKLFKGVEGKVNKFHSRLHMQIAKCYMLLDRVPDAVKHLKEEIDLDFDNATAHFMLGRAYLKTGDHEEAKESLLTAVGLNFNEPRFHSELGLALFNLGHYKETAVAWENSIKIMPKQAVLRDRLISLYRYKLKDEESLIVHAEWMSKLHRPTIYIVSGLPRSGTSLMMQMLEEGGLEIFTDKQREADENNPKGYYEHELVKGLTKNNKFIGQAKGKVVKVISHLLKYLPEQFDYKIIFMERDLTEVLSSQERMLLRLKKKKQMSEIYNLELEEKYRDQVKRVKEWISTHRNFSAIYLPYSEVVESPFEHAMRINEFLDYQLLPEKMVKVVDPLLYREKKILS